MKKASFSTFFKFINDANLYLTINKTTPQDDFLTNVCLAISLNFVGAQISGFLPALVEKIRVVIPSFVRSVPDILKTIEKYRCSSLNATAKTMFDVVNFSEFNKYDVSSIKFIHSGSQFVSADLVQKSFEKFNLDYFVITYGMTEKLMSASHRIHDPKQRYGESFPVGKPHPFFEYKIVDLKTKEIVPLNTPGELLVKSFTLFCGYWKDLEKTKEAFDHDGWLKTGDLAQMDELGQVRIKNRIQEVYKFGEIIVFPSEIEAKLRTHENVADASVFSITDGKGLDLCGCTWVILKDKTKETSVHELQTLVGKKFLEWIKFVDDFPTNENGKINKKEMARLTIKYQNRQ